MPSVIDSTAVIAADGVPQMLGDQRENGGVMLCLVRFYDG